MFVGITDETFNEESQMIYAYRTETGRRSANEDYCSIPAENEKPIAIVADGMGGHRAGNIASCIAVESIVKYVETSTITNTRMLLQHAISYANKQIFDAAQQDESCAGMGTTVVMAYVRPQRFTFANVGDSRLYLFNGESLKLITREQSETHPQRNILMLAVGTSPFIKADTGIVEWKDGDIIMLCSDGLHGSMNISLAEEILSSESNLLTACDRLTDAALAAGSSDNVTVVLVKNAGGIGA